MHTEQARCNTNCHSVTTWSGRSPKRVKCTGCKTVFPCPHDCAHWDCLEAKGLAAPDKNGILRTNDELAATAKEGAST